MPDFWTVCSLIMWEKAWQGVGHENTTNAEVAPDALLLPVGLTGDDVSLLDTT